MKEEKKQGLLLLKSGDIIAITSNLMIDQRLQGTIIFISKDEIHLKVSYYDKPSYYIIPRINAIITVIEKYDSGIKIYPKED